jgi:hypothetical protein
VEECYEIAKFAFDQRDFYSSALWMKEVLSFSKKEFLNTRVSYAEVEENMILSMANYFILVF